MEIKEGVVYTIQTGYKIWSNASDETVNYEVDAEPFEAMWEGSQMTAVKLSVFILFISYVLL